MTPTEYRLLLIVVAVLGIIAGAAVIYYISTLH